MGQVTHWPVQDDKWVLSQSDQTNYNTLYMMHTSTQHSVFPWLSRHQRESMKSF